MNVRVFTVYKGYYLVPFSQHVGEGRHIGHCEIHAHFPRGGTAAPQERVTTGELFADAESALRAARDQAQAVVDGLAGPSLPASDRPWDSR